MKELNNCYMSIVGVGDSYYAFDENTYEIQKLNDKSKEIFEYLIENREWPKDNMSGRELIQIAMSIKKGNFFSENKKKYINGQNIESFVVSFPIQHKCNLRCKYCFAHGGDVYEGTNREMQIQVIDKFVERIKEKNTVKKIRLEFVSGGENFIDKKKYIEIVDHFKMSMEKNDIELNIFTESNGTLLDSEIIDYLDKNNISLGISIDGPKGIHDEMRCYVDGRGSYNTIIDNLNKCYSKSKKNIWVLSVVTSNTKSLAEIIEHNMLLGVDSMELRIVRGSEENDFCLSEKNLQHFVGLYEELVNYFKEKPERIKNIYNNYDSFGKILMRLITKNKIVYRCQAGKNKFSITADGDIYPCDSFVGMKGMKIGNVYYDEVNEEVLQYF